MSAKLARLSNLLIKIFLLKFQPMLIQVFHQEELSLNKTYQVTLWKGLNRQTTFLIQLLRLFSF